MTASHENQSVVSLIEPGYGFDDRGPSYHLAHAGSCGHQVFVDPAPGYAHDEALVTGLFTELRDRAPLPFPLKIFILHREPTDRCNGWYTDDSKWLEVDGVNHTEKVGLIGLAGKRIPPHPAMTRYLVAHEYGHAVFYHLAVARDIKETVFKQQYIDQVRPEASLGYGCGKWHQNVGEVFANDFRILVMQREREFWPHQGIPHPDHCPAAITFWQQVSQDLWDPEPLVVDLNPSH